jgi:hypothetical protein
MTLIQAVVYLILIGAALYVVNPSSHRRYGQKRSSASSSSWSCASGY